MDRRENKRDGGLSSPKAPTVTSCRFSRQVRDTLEQSAKKWVNQRDVVRVKMWTLQHVTYSSLRCRRYEAEVFSKLVNGKPDKK